MSWVRDVGRKWIPLALLVALLFAGIGAVIYFWPMDGGQAAKAQTLSGLLAFVASLVLAFLTWAYLNTTREILQVQQEQLREYRPQILIEVQHPQCSQTGTENGNSRIGVSLMAELLVTNRSLTTPTTIRLLDVALVGVEQKRRGRRLLNLEEARILLEAKPTTISLDSATIQPGITARLRIEAQFTIPNEPPALPDPVSAVVRLADSFSGELAPVSLSCPIG